MRVKITEAGQACRKCSTPVRVGFHSKAPKYKPGGYYFSRWLMCPKCKAMYMLEAAQVWFDMPASFDFAAEATSEVSAITNAPIFEETARMRDASILPWD